MYKIAGCMTVRNYNDRCMAFQQMRELCDIVIVLDHNSDMPFKYRDQCDEYLTLTHKGLWCDAGNRTLLLYHAFARDCRWVVQMDDDLLFSHKFQTKDHVREVIKALDYHGKDEAAFSLRDMWGDHRTIREDGVWGRKSFYVVRRNFFFEREITLPDPNHKHVRLHSQATPINKQGGVLYMPTHRVYHTGCLTLEQRRERVRKYAIHDPGNAIYNYMLDTTGIALSTIPARDQVYIDKRMTFPPQDVQIRPAMFNTGEFFPYESPSAKSDTRKTNIVI